MKGQQTAESLAQSRKKADKDFVDLVQRCEVVAKANPASYRLRVRLLAASAYGFIFLMVVGAIGLFVAICLIRPVTQILIGLGLFIIAVLRSLWIKMEAPDGIEKSREELPKLWSEIDKISNEVNSVRVDKLLIDADMNAAAYQVPRFGIFGMYRNYLVVGVPLLMVLTPDEFRSVVAHELGHFSGKHGRFGSWAYRIHSTFENLEVNLRKRAIGSLIFGTFFKWFIPRFAATTFVLRREHEYEADSVAARIAGPRSAGMALLRMQCIASWTLEKYRSPLFERIKIDPEPPASYFSDLGDFLLAPVDSEYAAKRIEEAFAGKTDYDDTHPSMTDRLRAIDFPLQRDQLSIQEEILVPVKVTAAQEFLGPAFGPIMREWDKLSHASIVGAWKATYEQHQKSASRLAELTNSPDTVELSQKEQLEKATLIGDVQSAEVALPLFEDYVAAYPDDAEGMVKYGATLVELKDERCVGVLREAMRLDPEISVEVINLIGYFEASRGNTAVLDDLKSEMIDAMAKHEVAHNDALNLKLKDTFVPHTLSSAKLASLVEQFDKDPRILKAYVAAKTSAAMPKPATVILLVRKKSFFEGEDANQNFVNSIHIELDEPRHVLFCPPKPKPWVKLFAKIPGSLVFERKA